MLHYPPLKLTRLLHLWAGPIQCPERQVCRPNGKGMGKEGVLSDVVPELFILPGLNNEVNVPLGV